MGNRAGTKRGIVQQVYIIARESGGIKIGISVRPRTRQSDLQSSTPEKLAIFKTYKPSDRTAADVEASFKKLMAPLRVRGEWFDCEADFAEIVVEAFLESDAAKLDFAAKYIRTIQEWNIARDISRRSRSRYDNGEYRQWNDLIRDLQKEHPALLNRVMLIIPYTPRIRRRAGQAEEELCP
jgi:hypothetical protein